MIIIETTNGPVMVNDHEVRGFQFDKKSGEAIVAFANDMPQRIVMKELGMTSQFEDRTMTILYVEDVRYVGDQSSETYKYEGSEIERLQAELENEKRKLSEMSDHAYFMREWFLIYQEAFDRISDDCNRAECENNGIYVNPRAIIDEAEKKYEESQKRFKKVSEKWER